MKIKSILDHISSDNGSNAKMDILSGYKENELLKRVIYLALSKRVKFYIKAIPEFTTTDSRMNLETALDLLGELSSRSKTGHEASDHLANILSCLDPDDAYVVIRIIDKDLKVGMGTSNINKVMPDLIEKTPYMGAKSFSEKLAKDLFKNGKSAISQVKMDGRYANAIINGGEVDLVSRQGETTHVGEATFMKELGGFPDCVINGELTIDGVDRYTANGIVASIVDIEGKRETRTDSETSKHIETFEGKHGKYLDSISKIRFTVWDVIDLEEYFEKKSPKKYANRLETLEGLMKSQSTTRVSMVESKVVKNYKEGMEHFQDSLGRGLEGTILKSLDGTWKDGKPNWQVKMKLEMNIDLRIIGFEYGTPGTKNENVISTIRMESSDGLLKTNPSGMKEDMMEYVTQNQEFLMGTIAEIRCCGLSQNSKGEWSTLHPSVVKLRDDKSTCDSLASAKEIEEMSKSLS